MADNRAQDACVTATCPPPSAGLGHRKPRPNGPVLIVDPDRERREQWQQTLAESGVFAIATSSELKALELLSGGTTFQVAIVGGTGEDEEESPFVRQLAKQRPDLTILAIDTTCAVSKAAPFHSGRRP